MTPTCADPEALARRIRDLRRLAGRTDPERFAIAVEDIAEQVTRLAQPNGATGPSNRREPPRPSRAAPAATNERRLMALARAKQREIRRLEAMLETARRRPKRRVGAACGDQLTLPLPGNER
jgi:hypothetical protein